MVISTVYAVTLTKKGVAGGNESSEQKQEGEEESQSNVESWDGASHWC